MWGLLHGLLLVIERPLLARLQSIDLAVFRAVRMSVVFVCVTMLWIFFKLPNFDHAISYLSGMFVSSTNPNPTKAVLQSGIALFAAGHYPASCFPLAVRANVAPRGTISVRFDGRADVS